MRPADIPADRRRDPHLILGPLTFMAVLALLLVAGAYLFASGITPEITVPDMTGRPFEQAVAELKKQGFAVKTNPTQQVGRDSFPVGSVIRTSPPAGSRVKAGRLIDVFIAADNAMIPVPDLTGLMLLDAENMLSRAGLGIPGAAGLLVGRKKWETVDSAAGTILSQTPEAGVMVKSGSPVDLVIAVSETADTMPDLVGMTRTEALDLLASKGCLVEAVDPRFTTTRPANTILSQKPSPGARLGPEVGIRLIVAVASAEEMQAVNETNAIWKAGKEGQEATSEEPSAQMKGEKAP